MKYVSPLDDPDFKPSTVLWLVLLSIIIGFVAMVWLMHTDVVEVYPVKEETDVDVRDR